jgi:hypothetical protein
MNHTDPLNQKIKHALDQQELDKETQQRLDMIRLQALDSDMKHNTFNYRSPVLAFGFVIAITISLFIFYKPSINAIDLQSIEAFEIITSSDELEMYENLEFYLWLEEQPMEKV